MLSLDFSGFLNPLEFIVGYHQYSGTLFMCSISLIADQFSPMRRTEDIGRYSHPSLKIFETITSLRTFESMLSAHRAVVPIEHQEDIFDFRLLCGSEHNDISMDRSTPATFK
jgi:hypothetical protein